MKKGSLRHIAILVGVVALTLLPFKTNGLFDVHDPTSTYRIATLIESLREGQIPAAWSNSLNFGYGYPLHLFYAPLFGYLGALMFGLTHSYEWAVKLALIIASLVGTIGMHRLLSRYGRAVAILGAIAYTFLPYRASALYVRGSYAEFLALSLLPWVIYSWTLRLKNGKRIAGTALVTALFVLSHNTLPLLFLPVLLILIGLYQKKELKHAVLALIIAAGLTTWFTLPVVFERQLVQIENVARTTDFHDHFLYLRQLWYSSWGYGGSTNGLGDNMSFMLGKGQLILAGIGAIVLALKKKWHPLVLYGVTALAMLFLSVSISTWLWEMIPVLPLLQFPWRTLGLVGLAAAAFTGTSLLALPSRYQIGAAFLLAAALIYTNISYFRPQEYRSYTTGIVESQKNRDELMRDKIPEYLPSSMPEFPGAYIDDGLTHSSVRVSGTALTSTNSGITISTAYMPQWTLTVDGQGQRIEPTSDGTIKSAPLPSGTHQIELNWQRTTIEQLGIWISVITLIGVIGLMRWV